MYRINMVQENGIVDEERQRLRPPTRLVFLLTSECNLHCRHCHMWMNRDTDRQLSVSEKLSVIEQFHSINPKGSIVFCGGELMLRKDEFFSLCELCRKLGLTGIAVTNGSLITSEDYERLLTIGPKVLLFSLDSHERDVHDWVRGTPGSYDLLCDAMAGLVNARKARFPNSDVKIITNTVLFEKNAYRIDDYIKFAKEMGIDGVRFQSLLPTLSSRSKVGVDPFYERHFVRDKERAIQTIGQVTEKYKNDNFVITNAEDFGWIIKCIENGNSQTPEAVCGAYDEIIFVDQDGDYSLCPNMDLVDGVGHIGNFRTSSLEQFWKGESAARTRDIMGNCRKSCGMVSGIRKGSIWHKYGLGKLPMPA